MNSAVVARAGEGSTLNNIGVVYLTQGNYIEQRRTSEDSLAMYLKADT